MTSAADEEVARTLAELEAFAKTIEPRAMVREKGEGGPDGITFGNRIYIKRSRLLSGSDLRPIVAHECGHVRQYRYCGLGIHPMVGLLGFFLLYGLVFFPIWGAWVRYRFELMADTVSWEWQLANGYGDAQVWSRCEWFMEQVAGGPYFYPLPKCWVRWGFRRRVEKVIERTSRSGAQ